ncbi:probable membrane protein NMA1128 [Olavius algarvensis Delta 1 endosymbiont]|nr:probable membrane protein NMA1128 [Olavius algarvensis Delta 1 endosymbiont]
MYLDILLWCLAVILVIGGLVGLVFPVLPGVPILYAGLLLAAWAEDFAYVGSKTLIVLGLMMALSYVLDFLAGAFGAKRFGASRRAVIGATLGAIIGIFFGIPGILLGPFIGAVLGELSNRPDLKAAGLAGVGATLGLALGVAAKLALAFAMLGIFVIVRFF